METDTPGMDLLYRQGGKLQSVQNPERGKWGRAPAVMLINPKYAHNVGAAVRACSCYGIDQLWYTGNRVSLTHGSRDLDRISSVSIKHFRLPREERMREYDKVSLFQNDRPLDQFIDCTPVAVEVRKDAEALPDFIHPTNPVYIFGPEDGSIGGDFSRLCHRFVIIPSRHCLNLAAAVNVLLYDRLTKMRVEDRPVLQRSAL